MPGGPPKELRGPPVEKHCFIRPGGGVYAARISTKTDKYVNF